MEQIRKIQILTKGGFPKDLAPGTYESVLRSNASQVIPRLREEIQGSISRIPSEISIFLLHRDDEDYKDYEIVKRDKIPVEELMKAFSDGKLRKRFIFAGVSNWETARVEETKKLWEKGYTKFIINSPFFSLMVMKRTIYPGQMQYSHEEMMDPNFQKGIKMMTYSALGGFSIFSVGWEKAKAQALEKKISEDRYLRTVYEALFYQENEDRYWRICNFTESYNKKAGTQYKIAQFALAYVLAHPRVDALVIGASKLNDLRETKEALELSKKLSASDLNFLFSGNK